jgi:hypothetical protein
MLDIKKPSTRSASLGSFLHDYMNAKHSRHGWASFSSHACRNFGNRDVDLMEVACAGIMSWLEVQEKENEPVNRNGTADVSVPA